VPLRQRHDLFPQFDIAIRSRRVSEGAGAHSHHRSARRSLSPLLDHLPHQHASPVRSGLFSQGRP
jgi:hypothetical protein